MGSATDSINNSVNKRSRCERGIAGGKWPTPLWVNEKPGKIYIFPGEAYVLKSFVV